jgi:hypothetical protein
MLHVDDDEIEVRRGKLGRGVQREVVHDRAGKRLTTRELVDGAVDTHRRSLCRHKAGTDPNCYEQSGQKRRADTEPRMTHGHYSFQNKRFRIKRL